MLSSTKYPSDLLDEQWGIIDRLLPKRLRRGRPPIDRRQVIHAIFYVLRSGCQWRMLPRDFPNWNTVYGIFRRWRQLGLWQKIHDVLREQMRKLAGKKPTPTPAIIDSQSVRTAEGGRERGDDATKKVTARYRWWLRSSPGPTGGDPSIVFECLNSIVSLREVLPLRYCVILLGKSVGGHDSSTWT
jgi:putative transposase